MASDLRQLCDNLVNFIALIIASGRPSQKVPSPPDVLCSSIFQARFPSVASDILLPGIVFQFAVQLSFSGLLIHKVSNL